MPGAVIAEGIALVIDMSFAGIGAVDNLVQLINAQGPIAAASSSASLIASITAPIPGVGALTNTVSLTLTLVKGAAYADENGAALGDYVSAVGAVVSIAGSLLAISTPLGWTALGIAAVGSTLTGVGFGLNLRDLRSAQSISPTTNTAYTSALTWAPPQDPLVLDLNGGGISTVGIDPVNPILFDHNADGVRTGTGWLGAGEGILTLDINGNGTVDSGRELFGDNTVLASGPNIGQLASNGFVALAQHDKDINGVADGKIDSADAIYSQLRIWQDANQDGVSQATELQTLAALGIQSINVTGTASNISLGGGNTQTWTGGFTRTNGATGVVGAADLAGSLLLVANNFYREFTDDPATTTAAQALPQMRGSGMVRDCNLRVTAIGVMHG